MPAYKYSMLFLQRVGALQAGWSESIYAESGDFTTQFRNLAALRAQLLGTRAEIVGGRIQQVLPAGAPKLVEMSFTPAFANDQDLPHVSALIEAKAANAANRRRFTLRGIVDPATSGGQLQPAALYSNILNQYLTSLTGNPWRFLGRNLSLRPQQVIGVDATGLVTMSAAFTVAAGNRVRVSRVFSNNLLVKSKVYTVIDVPSSTTFRIQGWSGVVGVGGRATNVTADQVLGMSGFTQLRLTSHKVGRPFGGWRGRR